MTREEYLDQLQARQRPIVGDDGCRRLREAVVGIAGFGGGGALTLELLVRAGIGTFRLLDKDCYEPSNLNRQLFATAETIGRPKAEVAAERVKQINPYASIEKCIHDKVTLANLEELLEGADLGMVCTDSPASHVIFQQVARQKKIRLICGWTNRMACGVWVLPYDQADCPAPWYRRWLRKDDDMRPMSEEEALALDFAHNRPDEWTPTVGFAPNCSACFTVSLAVKYLAGMDSRPLAAQVDFAELTMSGPPRGLMSALWHRLRG